MKTLKKPLALLLVLLLLGSLAFAAGVPAFAAEETQWVAVAFSKDGLKKGDYYFDLSAFQSDLAAKLIADGMSKTAARQKAKEEADFIRTHDTIHYNPETRQVWVDVETSPGYTVSAYYPEDNQQTYDDNIGYIKQYNGRSSSLGFSFDLSALRDLMRRVLDLFKRLFKL